MAKVVNNILHETIKKLMHIVIMVPVRGDDSTQLDPFHAFHRVTQQYPTVRTAANARSNM